MEEERVLGFALEPKSTKTKKRNKTTVQNESNSSKERKTDNLLWCLCGRCSVMCGDFFLDEDECVCCFHLKHIWDNFDLLTIGCISRHSSFDAVVLNKDALYTHLVGLHDAWSSHLPPRNNVPAQSYRFAAYRQFTWFAHNTNKMKRGVRRRIPACVLRIIRNKFPSEDGDYVGFKENRDEIVWTFT